MKLSSILCVGYVLGCWESAHSFLVGREAPGGISGHGPLVQLLKGENHLNRAAPPMTKGIDHVKLGAAASPAGEEIKGLQKFLHAGWIRVPFSAVTAKSPWAKTAASLAESGAPASPTASAPRPTDELAHSSVKVATRSKVPFGGYGPLVQLLKGENHLNRAVPPMKKGIDHVDLGAAEEIKGLQKFLRAGWIRVPFSAFTAKSRGAKSAASLAESGAPASPWWSSPRSTDKLAQSSAKAASRSKVPLGGISGDGPLVQLLKGKNPFNPAASLKKDLDHMKSGAAASPAGEEIKGFLRAGWNRVPFSVFAIKSCGATAASLAQSGTSASPAASSPRPTDELAQLSAKPATRSKVPFVLLCALISAGTAVQLSFKAAPNQAAVLFDAGKAVAPYLVSIFTVCHASLGYILKVENTANELVHVKEAVDPFQELSFTVGGLKSIVDSTQQEQKVLRQKCDVFSAVGWVVVGSLLAPGVVEHLPLVAVLEQYK
jgi:hypothetical protein